MIATRAQAHPAPALPPMFAESECITKVSAEENDVVNVAYSVAFDDVAYGAGDIELEDARTHQLFAFEGQLLDVNGKLSFVPWDDVDAEPVALPLWISRGDVARAAKAAESSADPLATFEASDVMDVLEEMPALAKHVQRVTADAARVPITYEQSQRGFAWDVSDVPAGVYSLVAYTFSPPWNGWTVRPGVVKVVDAEEEPSAVVLRSVTGLVRGAEGRVIGGCAELARGAHAVLSYRIVERPELGWIAWDGDDGVVDVHDGAFDVCFSRVSDEVVGSVQFRVGVEGDGFALSPDTLTALGGDAVCSDADAGDATSCCAAPNEMPSSTPSAAPSPSCAALPTRPQPHALPSALALIAITLSAWRTACTSRRRRQPALPPHAPTR